MTADADCMWQIYGIVCSFILFLNINILNLIWGYEFPWIFTTTSATTAIGNVDKVDRKERNKQAHKHSMEMWTDKREDLIA
jgi:hypothetical protein